MLLLGKLLFGFLQLAPHKIQISALSLQNTDLLFQHHDVFLGALSGGHDASAYRLHFFLSSLVFLVLAPALLLLVFLLQYGIDVQAVFVGQEGGHEDALGHFVGQIAAEGVQLGGFGFNGVAGLVVGDDEAVQSHGLLEVVVHLQHVGSGDGGLQHGGLRHQLHQRAGQKGKDRLENQIDSVNDIPNIAALHEILVVLALLRKAYVVSQGLLGQADGLAHGHAAVVGVAQLQNVVVSQGNEVLKIAKKHVQESVLVNGVVVQLLHREELVGDQILPLHLSGDEVAVLGEVLHRRLGHVLYLFNGDDLTVGTDELSLLLDRLLNEYKTLLDGFHPVGIDGTEVSLQGDSVRICVDAGQGSPVQSAVPILQGLLTVIQ